MQSLVFEPAAPGIVETLFPSANTGCASTAGYPIVPTRGGPRTLVIANIIAVSFQVRSRAELQKRAGCLAVTHLIPLCSGFSFSLPAHVYRIKQGPFQWAHRWLGRLCVVHCLLHGSILVTVARNTRLEVPLIIPLVVREQGQSIAASPVYPQNARLEK